MNEDVSRACVKDVVTSYLECLSRRGAILDSIGVSASEATWESRYPFMPVRLLAIEAAERFGSTLYEEPPSEARGYPYRRREMYFGRDEYGLLIYIGSSDNLPACDEAEIEDTQISWVIDDPTGVMDVDIFFTPVAPVSHIVFKGRSDRFESLLAEML